MEAVTVSCSKNPVRDWLGSRAISNLIATLILISVAVVGGAFAYTAFRNQAETMTTAADVQVQSLKAVDIGGAAYVSATAKNVGSVRLVGLTITVDPGGESVLLSLGNLNPGEVGSASETWGNDAGETALNGGSSYPVLVEATTPDGGSIAKTMTVRVER